MKKHLLLFFVLVSIQLSFAQDNGITYQAVIYEPSGEELPGRDNMSAPLADTTICLQFSIIDVAENIEYQEVVTTKTDRFGMVNLTIGTNKQTGGFVDSFDNVSWDAIEKYLKIEIDVKGSCSRFEEISNQRFNYVPMALNARNAENVSGTISVENGGTGANTMIGAKTNLELELVDNTRDLDKPLSLATQEALDEKENNANKSLDVLTDGLSDVMYPSVKAVKKYVDEASSAASASLASESDRAKAAETLNADNLSTETSDRILSDNAITTNLSTEVSRAEAAEATLTTNVAAINTLANGTIYLGNASNEATEVALSGDVTINNTGVSTIGPGKIVTGTIADANVTYAKIQNVTSGTVLGRTSPNAGVVEAIATTGTGTVVLATAPTLVAPSLGTPSALVGTNITGTAAGLTAGNVTTNANLTGPITSVGNATAVASQTGTGSTFVMNTSPTLTGVPVAPTASAGANTTQIATTGFVTNAVSTATTGKYVDLTADQTIAGNKTFSGTTSGITKAMVGLGTVDNTTDANKPVSTATQTALNLKANLASPSLTGTPVAPTANAGTNTTQIATTGFVTNAVSTATTGTFVDLTTDQTIAGTKNFNGNIGIGTSAPKERLHISGDDSDIDLTTYGSDSSTIDFDSARGTTASPSVLNDRSIIGALKFNAWDGAEFNTAAYIQAYADGPQSLGKTPGSLYFSTAHATGEGEDAMKIDSEGDVRIYYNLEVDGYVAGASFITTSDKRLKTNILPIDGALQTIKQLAPYSYSKKSDLKSTTYNTNEFGFLAQDIQALLPFLVKQGTDKDQLLSLNYTSFIALLVKGMQEQAEEIVNIKNEHQEEIAIIKKEIEAIKKAL